MKSVLLFLVAVSYAAGAVMPRPLSGAEVEDTWMEPLEILTKYGYPNENHTVQTEDGYLLTLHRIPHGRLCGPEKSKGPVLIQHGLFSSSVDWFIEGTEKGLAYFLADHCYDVWLGNSRGNTYSKNHVSLDVHSSEYWDFSWHELGVYDTPAFIDYILHATGWKDLLYVGHSQGTTQFFIFNSFYPEYSTKVRGAFLLAPSAFMGHSRSTMIQLIAHFQSILGWVADTIGLDQFMPHTDFISAVGGKICSDLHPNLEAMCSNIVFAGCGFDSAELNTTMLPIFLGHIPAGAATKQLLHYAQSFNTGKFRQYDYGLIKNLRIYGQRNPPDYDLSKMTVPTLLYYSKNDYMAAVEDVDIVASQIGSLVGKFLVPYEKWNHLDYVIANDVVPILYEPLLDLMNRF